MRILYLNPGGHAQGGAERSLALLVEGMTARGHETFVELFMPGDAESLFAGAGAVTRCRPAQLDAVRRHGSTLSFLRGAAESVPAVVDLASDLRRQSQALGVDLIHSNGFRTHLLAPLLRRNRVRQVWSLRDRAPRKAQRLALAAASFGVNCVAANSRFTAAQLTWRRGLVEVVPNPVRITARTDQRVARLGLRLPLDRPVVAVVAHLHPSKGHHVAIKAIAAWPAGDRPLLAIAGGRLYGDASNRYDDELRELVRSLGVEADVMLLGGVADIGSVYGAADLVVQPAIHPEGFGRVVVEAQMSGVPVVATAIGGARELIEDGVTGLLVPPDDEQALRRAMRRVLGDVGLVRAMTTAGKSAAERYSPERHIDAMESLYGRVLAG